MATEQITLQQASSLALLVWPSPLDDVIIWSGYAKRINLNTNGNDNVWLSLLLTFLGKDQEYTFVAQRGLPTNPIIFHLEEKFSIG